LVGVCAREQMGSDMQSNVFQSFGSFRHTLLCLTLAGAAANCGPAAADEMATIELRTPKPYQVCQRQDFDPRHAHDHGSLETALGFADVAVETDLSTVTDPLDGEIAFEARAERLPGASGAGTPWSVIRGQLKDRRWIGTARVPGGGWYRLQWRARRGDRVVVAAKVEPVGVGEVFVIAGQSYAVGANDELTKVADEQGRVVAYDVVNQRWQIANDPQPNCGDGGTIWPITGDFLLPLARVPIGFVNVAVGGTSTRQWLPGEKLHQQLAAAGKSVGRFRAVLWQQGESDVIEDRSTEYYVRNLLTIREALAKEWDFEPPWLLAKSTLHPTVYNQPEREGCIRAAIDQLWAMPGFRPGPDTDILGGENRGGIGTRRHFSGIGQRRAGLMWFAAIWQELNRAP
jgi:hypothetical protein